MQAEHLKRKQETSCKELSVNKEFVRAYILKTRCKTENKVAKKEKKVVCFDGNFKPQELRDKYIDYHYKIDDVLQTSRK